MRSLLLALTLLALLAAPARAEVLEELSVPTRDGDTVHVEIARPEGGGRVPVILTYSPYNTLGGGPATNLASGSPWVEKGYAVAVADVVGTRNSTGCWDYGGPREQRSGVDVVGALARAPWSSGKVALTGVSYDGTTANMVAAAGDVPGLAAIVPVAAISRWYGYAYQDGVRYFLNSESPTDEGFDTPLLFDFGLGRTPPDRPEPQPLLDRLNPCDAAEHTAHGYDATPDYDGFWLARDYRKDAARFRVPVMVVHGWQDYNVKQSEGTSLFEAIPVDDPATAAVEGVPFKAAHLMQDTHADGSGDGYDARLEAFFARTLKGERNGFEFEPAVRTQTRTGTQAGDFARETSFPPPGTRTVPLELGAGRLAPQVPEADASFTAAGLTSEELALGSPDSETSWRWYVSAPLDAPVRLAGTPVLRARVAVDSTSGQLAASLVDVAPDGSATPISRGHLSLLYRDGLRAARAVEPGRPMDVTLRLAPQDQTVPAGHGLGLLVAGSNVVWAVPDAGAPRTFTLREGVSRLELPVVGPVDAPAGLPGVAPPVKPKGTVRRPRLTARLRRLRGGLVRVSGRAPAGARVTVRLRRGARTVARRTVLVRRSRRYAVRFRVRGRVRAVVDARLVGGVRLRVRAR